ncbi:glycosyltransferase family 4 protein [Sediminibacterium soli]|uniref:glycosyltransferase family 4 protein n=1 Tax=Sediminibacterium soli TaxID=2698829 RepID=UPI00137A4A1B|nr:glycosyltransferase family 4 protein [Sediminibacterium soli]NCI48066.1 glycosyltransferase family 4 protein [Sediminibacterium soli]
MRILLIHQYYLEVDDPGGSRWNEITQVWKSMGCEVTVIAGMMHYNGFEKASRYKGKYFVVNDQLGIKVFRCHVSEHYNSSFLGRLWGYFSFVFSSVWAGLFKVRGQFDIVIVSSPPLFIGISGYVISRIKRAALVFEIRDLWPESAIDTGVVTNKFVIKIAYLLEAFIYKKAKLISVLTPAFRTLLIRNKNVSPDKIILIPNAADFKLSEELLQNFNGDFFRKQHRLNENFVITYVGAHGVANHLIQIIEAAELLKDTPILFLLIGDGMQKQMLIEQVSLRGLTNVRFIDSVPKQEVFKYILASDMGASVLKKADTFKTVYSNKTFDYMSCKKPILMAIDGVSRELVENANAGIFVDPENPKDFADKVRMYLQDESLAKNQGLNGYNYAKANFDRTVLARRYLDCLRNMS